MGRVALELIKSELAGSLAPPTLYLPFFRGRPPNKRKVKGRQTVLGYTGWRGGHYFYGKMAAV